MLCTVDYFEEVVLLSCLVSDLLQDQQLALQRKIVKAHPYDTLVDFHPAAAVLLEA
jgi:hypothetical protein